MEWFFYTTLGLLMTIPIGPIVVGVVSGIIFLVIFLAICAYEGRRNRTEEALRKLKKRVRKLEEAQKRQAESEAACAKIQQDHVDLMKKIEAREARQPLVEEYWKNFSKK